MKYFLILLLAGCAQPKVYEHGPLLEQMLRPRPGHTGKLTNQVQRETGPDVLVYDLVDPQIREQLRAVKLICNVAGVRYRICRDRPGLCSQREKVKTFLGIVISREIEETSYIPAVEGYQRLIDGATWCAAQESTVGREMFP